MFFVLLSQKWCQSQIGYHSRVIHIEKHKHDPRNQTVRYPYFIPTCIGTTSHTLVLVMNTLQSFPVFDEMAEVCFSSVSP